MFGLYKRRKKKNQERKEREEMGLFISSIGSHVQVSRGLRIGSNLIVSTAMATEKRRQGPG
jgi:hypothetical protein